MKMSLPLQQSFKIHEEKLAELKGETDKLTVNSWRLYLKTPLNNELN